MIKLYSFFLAVLVLPTVFAERVYVSNALGMPIREIRELRVDEFQFVLKVEETEELIIRTLLKDQEEFKRWELQYNLGMLVSESLFVDGIISEARLYQQGRVLEERYYEDGNTAEWRVYEYSDGMLRQVSGYDSDGKLSYRDIYERSTEGRLRRVTREGIDESRESAFTYAGGRLIEEWHGEGGEGLLFRYHEGERLAEETWEGLKLLLAEEILRYEGKKEVVKDDKVQGLKTTQYFSDGDKVAVERTESSDDLIEHIRYKYTEKKITQKTRITRSAKEDWQFVYDDSGELQREILVRNDQVVRIIDYLREGEYTEDIYREGKPALRIYFKDGQKIDEEFVGEPVNQE